MPVLQCCSRGRETHPGQFEPIIYYWVEPDRDRPWRAWILNHPQVMAKIDFCPFCGTKVPEMVEVPGRDKICSFSDGGYYCDTCGDRLISCTCQVPSTQYRIKE